jgi:hypothetical protein
MPRTKLLSDITFYRIFCLDPSITDCYVGQTCHGMRKRMYNHRYESKKNPDRQLYKFIGDNGGWSNWTHEELETRACWDWELSTVEREWTELCGATLNNNMPGRGYSEWKRKYYAEHRDELNSKAREKVTCSCGSTVTRDVLSRHRKSKKHQRWEAENAD